MAHKTLIGGTAYEISGGKTLVNGTAYSIDKGKTLVGGTAYEVGFAPTIGTCYLRPSADITVRDGVSAYPSGNALYQCIDEEVADGDSTYIYTTGGIPQTIQFYGTLPANATITAAKYIAVMKRTGTYGCNCNLSISGSSVLALTCANDAYTEYSAVVSEDVVSILNTSNSNGSVEVDAIITPTVNAPLEDKSGSTTLYVTQIYIELTYEV